MSRILCRPETSVRLIKWAFELEEFENLYRPRIAIKGQVLANFIAKFTYPEESDEEIALPNLPSESHKSILTWVLYGDGSSNNQGSGARVILIAPDRIQIECAPRLKFGASNNKAE